MNHETEEECKAVFRIFDADGSNQIDKNEAVKHWKDKFGQISAIEFFNTVDIDHNGIIDYLEFLTFWEVVKGSGHDDEEIMTELENIR